MPVLSPDFPFCASHIRNVKLEGGGKPRYEEDIPTELQKGYKAMVNDGNKRDLSEEIALARTLLNHYIQKLNESKDLQGKMVINEKDAEKILQALHMTRMLVESQSKVNPDRVVSVGDMKAIISKVIEIVRNRVPMDQMSLREHIVGDIQRYCMSDLMAKALEVPFGSSVSRKSDGPTE
jgi:hypothetical protein